VCRARAGLPPPAQLKDLARRFCVTNDDVPAETSAQVLWMKLGLVPCSATLEARHVALHPGETAAPGGGAR
jgi:hypothetical protein